MNERIRELEEVCWEELGEEEGMYPVFNTEKFAKLIVKECEMVAKNPQWYSESRSNGWRNPIRHVCREFKEHFGIKA